MKKETILTSLIIIILSFFITNCTADRLYTKDEYMALGEDSKNSINKEVQEAQLVNPAYEKNGYYLFSSVGIRKNDGKVIINGEDFEYNLPLNSIYDIGNNGSLLNGHYFRVVHNGTNVIDGLGLTPVAKDLSDLLNSLNLYPSSDQIYIDPQLGRFILPRPIYWSRCESIPNIKSSPDIGNGDGINYNFILDSFDGKFNNYIKGISSVDFEGIFAEWYPQGNTWDLPEKGTLSFWVNYHNGHFAYFVYLKYFAFFHTSSSTEVVIYINGYNVDLNHFSLQPDIWQHIYIVWDINKELTGGRSIMVYMDNQLILETSVDLVVYTPYNKFSFQLRDLYDILSTRTSFDNIKLWDHVVSEDPAWIYNNGNGIEEAFHINYGQESNYHPDIQVGYFYK